MTALLWTAAIAAGLFPCAYAWYCAREFDQLDERLRREASERTMK